MEGPGGFFGGKEGIKYLHGFTGFVNNQLDIQLGSPGGYFFGHFHQPEKASSNDQDLKSFRKNSLYISYYQLVAGLTPPGMDDFLGQDNEIRGIGFSLKSKPTK
jgi:hypothetical protein